MSKRKRKKPYLYVACINGSISNEQFQTFPFAVNISLSAIEPWSQEQLKAGCQAEVESKDII